MGIEVTKLATGIHMSQAKYIANLLARNDMVNCNLVPTFMSISHLLTKEYVI